MRYRMREKMFSIGDDYWIEDGDGNRVFRVHGKALRFRDTFVLEDASGREVGKIQERKLSLRDKMAIERDGHTIATGNQDKMVRIYDARKFSQEVAVLDVEIAGARALRFSPLGSGPRVLAFSHLTPYKIGISWSFHIVAPGGRTGNSAGHSPTDGERCINTKQEVKSNTRRGIAST